MAQVVSRDHYSNVGLRCTDLNLRKISKPAAKSDDQQWSGQIW
jgi:hypothetical protein